MGSWVSGSQHNDADMVYITKLISQATSHRPHVGQSTEAWMEGIIINGGAGEWRGSRKRVVRDAN